MNSHGYTEDDLVKRPALDLLAGLGWETVDAFGEFARPGSGGKSALGRETEGEVILVARLRSALERLNPNVSEAAIARAIEELARDRSRMSPAAANREIYGLLKDGVRATVPAPDEDGEAVERIEVIDWNEPTNNDFLVCSEFWVAGEMDRRRADLVGFVNGLPLLFCELKSVRRRLEDAYNDNLRDYRESIPQLFWFNGLIVLSNGLDSRVGSVTAGWEHFGQWKKIGSEEEEGRVSLETMLRGVCDPPRLLDLVENFTLFQAGRGGLVKLVAKNHQYLGVNAALEALRDIRGRQGRLGVFWHTQGSGKSVSMIFFAQKAFRRFRGNWTFVLVTDRRELDGQLYRQFASSGAVGKGGAQAESSQELRQLLSEDHRYVFTLIHKFRTETPGEEHPVLSERDDIVVIADEAHRSQYDTLALNMRQALPNAAFLAFTGTPLIAGEESTRRVFGDYVSVYDFQQSVEDRATVPLFYENRIPELQISNPDLNEDMARLLDEAALDEAQEKKLEREFAREYHLITRDDRLEAVAEDLVRHFSERGFRGKAMAIAIDKATAVRMFDKVQAHWTRRIDALRHERSGLPMDQDEAIAELDDRIAWMEGTDMAVVVSSSQNEIADMKAKGLDFRPHRRRMRKEDLEEKFKDPDDPFRLAFVCAMWMTGFDVPSCSTLYLDKPMRNHTLMQTIARANRVYPGKEAGLIVDYVGVFRNLERALSIYGAGAGGSRPVESKATLIAALRTAMDETERFCREQGVALTLIENVEGMRRLERIADAVDALVASGDVKRRYLSLANRSHRLFKAVLPDVEAQEFRRRVKLLSVLADRIRALTPTADISLTMKRVEDLLDESVETEAYAIGESGRYRTDLSKIDFEKLAAKFKRARKRTVNEKLTAMVKRKVEKMVRENPTRTDFLAKLQAKIDAYNAGTLNAEEFFRQVVEFTEELDEEERRGLAEQLDPEELAVFDILTQPGVEMGAADREKVKVTARELLEALHAGKLALDWRKKQQARAAVRVTIEQRLDAGLPRAYTPDLFQQKAAAVFQHVYASYFGGGKSVYEAA
ncbi:MAG: type I restriction endonuclease subunit R [Acidobacteriota bacterium]|nr:type I restriction endonuclease subunit R [Acidobacteriota bacterium]MDE3264395.1 type I restriction endonuclease subunit R [Acidobacteriota bacterium]